MSYASVVSPIGIVAADDVKRCRHRSDEEKVRIFEESLRDQPDPEQLTDAGLAAT
jgi:hypothetical protein